MSGWTDVRALLPGLRGPRVHVVAAADETALRSRLSGAGFDLLTVAGRAITNEGTLLQEMARAFALPEGFGDNWDALADALGDLAGRPDRRLALLWVDADASLAADLQALLSAVLLLDRTAADLAEEHEGSRQLEIFLLGSGAGFPDPADPSSAAI
jgi:RNAse (barnase) inhibitor barstar